MNNEPCMHTIFPPSNTSKSAFFLILFATLLSLAVVACGGGGGGGDSSSQSESKEGIRVLHASIEAAPVDVLSSVSESPIISQAFFADRLGYHSLAKEVQTLSLTRALSPSRVVASFEVDGASLKRGSLLLFGDVSTFGLRAKLLEDRFPEVIPQSVLRLIHGATGASAVRVQILAAGESLVEEVVDFGDESSYLDIPVEESLQVVVRRLIDGRLLASPTLTFEQGKAYTLLVAGEVDYYLKTVLYRDN